MQVVRGNGANPLNRAMAYLEMSPPKSQEGPLLDVSEQPNHWIYPDTGRETEVNALYVQVLQDAAKIADKRGELGRGQRWRAHSEAVKAAINAELWDQEKGVYRQSTGQPENVPQDGNIFAILNGVAPSERAESSLDYLHENLWTEYGSKCGTGSMPQLVGAFINYYEVLARFEAGRDEEAWELIDRVWGYMFLEDKLIEGVEEEPATSSWEHINLDGTPYREKDGSLSHPWSSGATALLTNQVLGVRPTAPGYKEYRVEPHIGDLRWAEGRVPTPDGNIRLAWSRRGPGMHMSLKAPEQSQGIVAVPDFDRKIAVYLDGELAWDGNRYRSARNSTGARQEDGYVYLEGVSGGTHDVRSRPAGS